ncbi:MAG: tetratricopeptide repeat protein [Xanthobacteraceae bacterium]|nr:tetratricopeptide repeat protein [Xanthobacteraceae bacterium]
MSELFDEVDEDLRREQLRKIWERYSVLIVAAAVLIVAGVGGWRFYQYTEVKKAGESGTAFEAAVALSDQNKSAEAEAAFANVATDGTKGYRALARLRGAAEAAKRDPKAAVQLYDGIAADSTVDPSEQDIARIRAASLLLDTASYAELRQRLEPLTAAGRTFRHTARELLSLSAWRSNDAAAARQWLDMIGNDPESPAAVRSRAEALQALLPPAAKS